MEDRFGGKRVGTFLQRFRLKHYRNYHSLSRQTPPPPRKDGFPVGTMSIYLLKYWSDDHEIKTKNVLHRMLIPGYNNFEVRRTF